MPLPLLATMSVPVPVRAWNQPGIVELLVHVADPVVGSVSKFCVYGVSSAVTDTGPVAWTDVFDSVGTTVLTSAHTLTMVATRRLITRPHFLVWSMLCPSARRAP